MLPWGESDIRGVARELGPVGSEWFMKPPDRRLRLIRAIAGLVLIVPVP